MTDVPEFVYLITVDNEWRVDAIADDHPLIAALAWFRYMDSTDEEREQWEREAAERRVTERASAEVRSLSLDALLDRLGWSVEYATHVVQPYCTCGDSYDGWERCEHAHDLSIELR